MNPPDSHTETAVAVTKHSPTSDHNPFQRQMAQHLSAGTVAIEEARAVAEAQGKLVIAKKFPRDPAAAYASIMEACKRPGLAAIAEYSFPRGGERVSGPSIRLAEELARCWGNIDYGIRELSRKDGVSEMEAYAWDMQTNTISSQKFTVRHIRDTKNGGKALSDERDIYELTANMAGRRLRARIMAILPADIVDAAVQECRRTLAGDNTAPLVDRVRKMIAAFDRLGVSTAMIERWLGKPLMDILPEQFAELTSIHNSIKDGVSKAGDWFDVPKPVGAADTDDLNAQIRMTTQPQGPAPAPAPTPAPTPAPAVQPAATPTKPVQTEATQKPTQQTGASKATTKGGNEDVF